MALPAIQHTESNTNTTSTQPISVVSGESEHKLLNAEGMETTQSAQTAPQDRIEQRRQRSNRQPLQHMGLTQQSSAQQAYPGTSSLGLQPGQTQLSTQQKSRFENYIETIHSKGLPIDINSLVQMVLRQAYIENIEDLHFYAEKVRFFNNLKKSVRDQLSKMRALQVELAPAFREDGSVDLEKTGQIGSSITTNLSGNPMTGSHSGAVENSARLVGDNFFRPGWKGGVLKFSLQPGAGNSIQSSVTAQNDEWYTAGGSERLENLIQQEEEFLNGCSDDAQLANVDLQNMLQKQQQTLQMMSNISKMLHDTAMAVLRKIGG